MSKHIPGKITAVPQGLEIEDQTVVWRGVAYEIPAQAVPVTAADPAHFRLVLAAGDLVLDETPLGEEPEAIAGEVLTLASFDLQPGQPVSEALCFNVAKREGDATAAAKTVQVGTVQRRGPSQPQVARRQRRRDAEALRAKLSRGDVLTPQEVSEALRVIMERLG